MRRLSKRGNYDQSKPVVQYKYVEIPSQPQVIEVEKEVIKEVEAPVQTVIVEKDVDLSPLHAKDKQLQSNIQALADHINKTVPPVYNELEMQRRVLVGLKMQRAIDRSRRLTFIKRVKRQDKEQKKQIKNLKLALCASLFLSIVSLIVRH